MLIRVTFCRVVFALLAFLAAPAGNGFALAADNWPNWRGPQVGGVASAAEYPVEFSSDDGVGWKTKLPGLGCSTPAVWDDKIFLTCGIDDQNSLVCYDFTTGKELWRKTLGDEAKGKHGNGSGSNPSPATDGKHVVVCYKSGELACFDLAGDRRWLVNLPEKFGPIDLMWDFGSSPVIAGPNAIVAIIHAGESYLAAFNLESGEVAWRQPRQYERPFETDQSYASPQLTSVDGKDVVVTWGADHLTGHNAATGKLLWDVDGFNPRDQAMWRVIASPAVARDMVVVPFGRGKFLAGVRFTANGNSQPENRGEKIWEKVGLGADVPTPAIVGDRIYLLTDDGKVVCLALGSGEEIFKGELPKNRHHYYSSPIVAGDKLFLAREDGKLFVAQIGDDFKLLAENDMGESIIATPIPIRGGLLIRGKGNLFWIPGPSGESLSQVAH